jgi:hypothetical protein
MSKGKSILICCAALTLLPLFANQVNAQDESAAYTVQIGTFDKPDLADFSHLSAIGFVYSGKEDGNYTSVFMGGYNTETVAEKVVASLQEKGYVNAFVSRLDLEKGSQVAVVQLATKQFNEKIDWDTYVKAGPLYLLLAGDQVKILTGIFPDVPTAKQQLARIQQAGIKGAFVKTVNNAQLHAVGVFEAGNSVKKPLIQLDIPEKPAALATQDEPLPAAYEASAAAAPEPPKEELAAKGGKPTENAPKTKTTTFAPAHPIIRSEVKRTAALELQKALKATGNYTGSLDGYFGKGSKEALSSAYASNRQLQKYGLLSRQWPTPAVTQGNAGSLQQAIDQLREQPESSVKVLDASKTAIAKAYKACHLFISKGPGSEVNQLMHQALREAFPTGKASIGNFDPAATYAYQDMESLLLHLSYIHQSAPSLPAVPCWLFRQFPGPAVKAFSAVGAGSHLVLQPCGGFWEWEEVKLLNTILTDLSPRPEYKGQPSAAALSKLYGLYLSPKVPGEVDRKSLEAWNTSLWQGIEGWASRDPMLKEISGALKISFFHTALLLEDYFMNEGFSDKEAKTLALSALQSLTGEALQRFI